MRISECEEDKTDNMMDDKRLYWYIRAYLGQNSAREPATLKRKRRRTLTSSAVQTQCHLPGPTCRIRIASFFLAKNVVFERDSTTRPPEFHQLPFSHLRSRSLYIPCEISAVKVFGRWPREQIAIDFPQKKHWYSRMWLAAAARGLVYCRCRRTLLLCCYSCDAPSWHTVPVW
jgi:hypothetical protein